MKNYRYIAKKVKGKRIDEHRLVMEQYLDRKLSRYEVVHHKDGNPENNALENLQLMTLSEHGRFHHLGKRPHITTERLRELGRQNRPNAKLEIEDVRNIRRMASRGIKNWLIAWIYKIRADTVSEIKRGRKWGWVVN